jgi:hypothetical protein
MVKMDVEGAEPSVLRGMERILAKVEVMIIESNAERLRAAGSSPSELAVMLAVRGFDVGVIREDKGEVEPWCATLTDHGFANLFAARLGPGS